MLIHSISKCILELFPGSERNVAKLTLDGVDIMGERLAEEVCSFYNVNISTFGLASNKSHP